MDQLLWACLAFFVVGSDMIIIIRLLVSKIVNIIIIIIIVEANGMLYGSRPFTISLPWLRKLPFRQVVVLPLGLAESGDRRPQSA